MSIEELVEDIRQAHAAEGGTALMCVLVDSKGYIHEFEGGDSPYVVIGAMEAIKQRIIARGGLLNPPHEPPQG